MILEKGLSNILVVVTRYFGGTLLGTGGLVKAYSDVAKLALENIGFKEMNLAVKYRLEIPYNDFSVVQHYCSTNNITITDSSFSDTVSIEMVLKQEKEDKSLAELREKLDGKLNISKIGTEFYI